MNFDDLVKQRFKVEESVETATTEESGAGRNFETILTIVRKINTSLVLSDVLELVTDEAIRIARAERGFIMLAGPDGKLQFVVGRNSTGQTIKAESFQVSSSVPEDVFTTGESSCVENALADKRFEHRQSIMSLELETIICAPLKTQEEKIGVLYVDSRTIQSIDKADILYGFEILAGHAAIAIKNARLYADLKHTYDELKQANLHIIHYERMAMKGELAAEVSHELKNLVSIVLLSLQRLQLKLGTISSEEINRIIDLTIAGVRKIEGFSKNLLSRARLSSRMMPLNLNKIINDFVDFMRFLPRFRANTITTNLDESVPPVDLDIDQIQQVLLNLMNNVVEARKDANVELRTYYSPEFGEVRLIVKDNGPGIDPAILPKLFFERVTDKKEGHGYGLTVCRQIIESHGGSIQVESHKGEGATFVIRLPAAAK